MGTRADFYIGKGNKAEWVASIAWDGYPDGIDKSVLNSKSETEFRETLLKFFSERNDVSTPSTGWPWPWETSKKTDFSYHFENGKVSACCFGDGYFDPLIEYDDQESDLRLQQFPDMNTKNYAQAGTDRSGVMIFKNL